MSSLMKIKETMTSLELVDLINKFRKLEGEKAVLRHNNFKASILKEFEGMLPEKHTYINPQNKQEYEYYELDFYQVIQLLMKESVKVRQGIIKYIKYLENQNLMLKQALWNKQNTEWLETRRQGKLTRRNETDVIASLILYATEQGSKNANKLYVVYSKLVNNLVGIESGMRDIVSLETLFNIAKLEDLFQSIMIDCMENSVYYKEIYKRCKEHGTQMMKYLNKDIKALNYNIK